MTAYELRRHLATQHGITTRGQPYDGLTEIHQAEHARGWPVTHTHTDDQEGEVSCEALRLP